MIQTSSSNPVARGARFLPIILALALALGFAACSDPDPTIESVRALHEEQRYAESIEPLEALLLAQPGEREALQLYGTALLASGEPALAIWPLKKLAESPEATVEERTLLARAHLAGGSSEDALVAAARVLEEHPNLLEALQISIEANERLKRYEDALAHAETILGYEPEQPGALTKRAALLLLLERTEEAEAAIADVKKFAATTDGPSPWTGRLCAIDATFIYEKREDDYLVRAREAWEDCAEQFPTDGLVVPEAIGFFDSLGDRDRGTEILRQALEAAPESVDFQIGLGQRLLGMGDFEEGERLLLEATEQPGGEQALQVLLEYYDARRDFAKARGVAEKMMALVDPPPLPLRLSYADLLIRARDFDAARLAIDEIEEPEFRSLLEGRLLLDMGKPRQALEQLDAGIRLWPSNSTARQLAAEAAEQLGDFDRAIAEYKEAVRADTNNLEALDKLARYQKAIGNAGMLRQLLGVYVRDNPGDPRGYRRWLELLRWSAPKSAMEPIRRLGQLPGHLAEAVAAGAALRENEPAEALAYIEKHEVDLLAPTSREVLAEWAKSQSKLGQHAAALAKVDAAIAAHPDVAALHVIRADALAAAARPSETVRASLDRALALAPAYVPALVATARLNAAAGEVDRALEFYDRALAAAPADDEVAWSAIELLVAQGRDEGVERRARKLLRAHPYHADAAHLLARRMVARGDELDRARDFARRAVRFGGGPEARVTLGWIEIERGKIDAAIELLRAAVEADPNAQTAQYHLGRALARSGDGEAARSAFEKALTGEAFPEAEAARAELARLGV